MSGAAGFFGRVAAWSAFGTAIIAPVPAFGAWGLPLAVVNAIATLLISLGVRDLLNQIEEQARQIGAHKRQEPHGQGH